MSTASQALSPENSDAFRQDILARGLTDAMEAYGKV